MSASGLSTEIFMCSGNGSNLAVDSDALRRPFAALSPMGNLQASNLFNVIRRLQRHAGLKLHVSKLSPATLRSHIALGPDA